MPQEEIQRALGRMEGQLAEVLSVQRTIREEFYDHKVEDRQNFQNVSSRFGAVYHKLEEQDVKREISFEHLEAQLTVINAYVENIKGAWWLVLLLTAVVGGVGAVVAWGLGVFRR